MPFEPVGGIAEIDRPRAVADEIVGIVETPPFKAVGEDGLGLAVCFQTNDILPTSALTQQEESIGVEGETVRTRLDKIWVGENSTAWLEKGFRLRCSGAPPIENVCRDIGEKQSAIFPDGALAPDESRANVLRLRFRIDERVQSWIETLDGPKERIRFMSQRITHNGKR